MESRLTEVAKWLVRVNNFRKIEIGHQRSRVRAHWQARSQSIVVAEIRGGAIVRIRPCTARRSPTSPQSLALVPRWDEPRAAESCGPCAAERCHAHAAKMCGLCTAWRAPHKPHLSLHDPCQVATLLLLCSWLRKRGVCVVRKGGVGDGG